MLLVLNKSEPPEAYPSSVEAIPDRGETGFSMQCGQASRCDSLGLNAYLSHQYLSMNSH